MEDGVVDRYFNRRLSGYLTRWFLKTSITPNQITLIAMMIGLGSTLFFWRGGYFYGVGGAILFQISAVLDCCDGEVARMKSLQSRFGRVLDLACDNIVHVALFLALAWSMYRESGSDHFLVLGVLAAMGSLLSLGLVLISDAVASRRPYSELGGRGTVSPQAMDRSAGVRGKSMMRKAADRLTNRDFSVILLLFALGGVLDGFLWLAAIGSNIFWMILLWLYQKEVRSLS